MQIEEKARRVIKSCKTIEQMILASTWVKLAAIKYPKSNYAFKIMLNDGHRKFEIEQMEGWQRQV